MKTVLSFIAALAVALAARGAANPELCRYTLLAGSTIIDECPICGRPSVAHPLRGTFDLALVEANPFATTYHVTNVQFFAGSKSEPVHTVTGHGTYQVFSSFAVRHEMTLQTSICNAEPSCRDVTLASSNVSPGVAFPLIEISLTQTQESLTSVYSIHLVAAPVREVWFTLTNGFTATNGSVAVAAGDLLANDGRIVRRNSALLEAIGLTNAAGPHVDALEVAPGGELLFSFDARATSPPLGELQEGDLVADTGRLVQRNQELTAAFGIEPVVPDLGLDAVHVTSGGDILFSIRTDAFSEIKGVMLRHGDVLSNAGEIVKNNQQLLARFAPENPELDYGVDALFAWPSGELWFSTTSGFVDQRLGPISGGDLLSSEGVIVFRQADLAAPFAAPETPLDFGLNSIFVVSDALTAGPPSLLAPQWEQGGLRLNWRGTNRVFQVERANVITGPWEPLSAIMPETSFLDAAAAGAVAQRFYRVRGW